MSKVMLPYAEPMFSTYHWLANAGIPATQNDTYYNWYYNNLIDWCCVRKFMQGFTSPQMSLARGTIWQIPFLEVSGINTRFARNCAIDIIKTMLDEGYYVAFTEVDDYYVQGKSWYKEKHFNHDGLIIGYDDEKSTLSIAAYDQRWIFTVFETPEKCFVEGMIAFCDKGRYGGLYAVKANNEEQQLDLEKINNDLKIYLSSSIKDYPLDEPNPAWGVVVYDYLCIYLDKLIDGSIPHERRDRRMFRLVWEHKKCMLGRIKAVEKLCDWDDTLSSAYEEIVRLADKIRFIYSKFVLKYSFKHIEKIQLELVHMKTLEKKLLFIFLENLKGEIDAGKQHSTDN